MFLIYYTNIDPRKLGTSITISHVQTFKHPGSSNRSPLPEQYCKILRCKEDTGTQNGAPFCER